MLRKLIDAARLCLSAANKQALGIPDETPDVVPSKDGDIKYWRDEKGQHFVPKRPFEEVCFINGYGKG